MGVTFFLFLFLKTGTGKEKLGVQWRAKDIFTTRIWFLVFCVYGMAASVFHEIVRALWFVLQWMILPRNHPCSWFSHWHDSAGWWKTGCKIQLFVFLSFHAVFFFFFQKSLFPSMLLICINTYRSRFNMAEVQFPTRHVSWDMNYKSVLPWKWDILYWQRRDGERLTTEKLHRTSKKNSLKPGLENREGVKRKAKLENLVRRRENWQKLNVLT